MASRRFSHSHKHTTHARARRASIALTIAKSSKRPTIFLFIYEEARGNVSQIERDRKRIGEAARADCGYWPFYCVSIHALMRKWKKTKRTQRKNKHRSIDNTRRRIDLPCIDSTACTILLVVHKFTTRYSATRIIYYTYYTLFGTFIVSS